MGLGRNGRLREALRLEANTGRQTWQTNSITDRGNGSCITLPRMGISVILFTNEGNLIRARLDAQGYHEVSRAHVLEPTHPFNDRKVLWPPPAYADRHVLARNDEELIRVSLAADSPTSP